MDKLIPMSEARARLHELVRDAQERPVFLLRHGRPAVVMLSIDQYQGLINRLEDLEDVLSGFESLHNPADMRIPLQKLGVELGLSGDSG